jgi:DNA polymerase phi
LDVYRSLVDYSTKFDRLTKSKTMEELLQHFPISLLRDFVQLMMERILTSQDSEKKWFTDQLQIIFRNPLYQQENSIVEEYLGFLCRYGFFTCESLSKSDQTMLRERLFSLLSIFNSRISNDYASFAVLEIEKLEQDNKKVVKLDSEIKKIRKSGLKVLKKLHKKVYHLKLC